MRKTVLVSLLILTVIAAQMALIEGAARLAAAYTPLGRAIELNPYPSYTAALELPPLPEEIIPSSLFSIRLREPSASDSSVPVKDFPPEPIAALAGGSSPHGHGIEYPDTFWGKLDLESFAGLRYWNTSMPGAQIDGSTSFLAWAATQNQFALLALYVGDNEGDNFNYPRVADGKFVYEMDRFMRNSVAYQLLSIGLRHLQGQLNAEVYPEYNLVNWFSFHTHCFDRRYRQYSLFSGKEVDAYRKWIVARFERYLDLMVAAAVRENVPLILYTTPIRYRMTPCHALPQLLTELSPDQVDETKLTALVQQGLERLGRSDFAGAKDILLEARRMDPQSALTNHYLGYAFEGLNDYSKAREYFEIARDRKIGKNGLLPTYNKIIRSKADEARNIYLIDLDREFIKESEKLGLGLNDELISDWCHPNEAGNMVIYAETKKLLARLKSNKIIPNRAAKITVRNDISAQ